MSAHSFRYWTPSVPIRKPDNIISSEYASLKVFKPSYEKETHVSMEQLLANEYQRIWLMERDEWLKKTFPDKTRASKKKPKTIIKKKDSKELRTEAITQDKVSPLKEKSKSSKRKQDSSKKQQQRKK